MSNTLKTMHATVATVYGHMPSKVELSSDWLSANNVRHNDKAINDLFLASAGIYIIEFPDDDGTQLQLSSSDMLTYSINH